MEIKEYKTEAEIRKAYGVIHQLRTTLDEDEYVALVKVMQPEGYRVFVGEVEKEQVCYAGIVIRTNLYDKKHVWVDDLVTLETARSNGYGLKMIEFLEGVAIEARCERISLSSGLHRLDAHRFYLESVGFERCSYQFRKDLRS